MRPGGLVGAVYEWDVLAVFPSDKEVFARSTLRGTDQDTLAKRGKGCFFSPRAHSLILIGFFGAFFARGSGRKG